MQTKNIILCADDYAQSPSISRGIVNLIDQKHLSATSCLTSSPYWPKHAAWLLPYVHQIDIGLHFDLTEYDSYSISKLLAKSHLHLLNKTKIKTKLNKQLDLFWQHLKKAPNFIDGHQHVHHLPIIRNALLEVYEERLRQHNAYIRIPSNGYMKSLCSLKKFIITATGANALKRQLINKKIPHNSSFAGIYNFKKNYQNSFKVFLKTIKNNGIIMCHPGLPSDDPNDPIAQARYKEYQFISSQSLTDFYQKASIILSRFLG